jgi:transposase
MSNEYDRRAAVIESLRAGHSVSEILKFFPYRKSTVFDIAKAYYEAEGQDEGSGSAQRQQHAPRSDRVRNQQFLEALQSLIEDDPGCSMRNLAKKLNVSDGTIRNAVYKDLRYKSYVLQVRQMLSEAMKEKRLAKCSLLLISLKHDASGRLRFFSDEKMFVVDAKINRRNDRWFALDPEEVPIIGKTKFPASVHVLLIVSEKGDVMPPHFFKKGENVNKEVYLNVIQTVVKPWMDEVAAGRPYIFQQDGAPAHTSNLVQNWMLDNLSMF